MQTHWISAETFLPARLSTAMQDREFQEWGEIDGIPYPAMMLVMGSMGEQIIYIDEIEFGADVTGIKFSMR